MRIEAVYGVLIPLLGTTLGAACVFFMRKNMKDGIQRSLTGFASGVMVAASVWSLLVPSIEQSESMGRLAFVRRMIDDNTLECKFDKPQRAVTPGQALVLYDGEYVLGGGTII